MTKTVAIFTQSYLIDIPNNIQDELNFVCGLTDEIEKLIQSKFPQVAYQSTQFGIYEPNVDNLGKCQKCGCWTTDSTQENRVKEVSNGAVVNGQLLCDVCLPSDHELAF